LAAGYIVLGLAAGGGVWLYCIGSITNLWLGLLIWSRRPDNRLGRILAAIGVLGPFSGLAILGGFGGVQTSFAPSGWRSVAGAVGGAPATGLVLVSLLWFPDGRLPSTRWRWLERTVVGWTVLWGVAGLLGRPLDGADHPFLSQSTADAFGRAYEVLLVGFGVLLLGAAWLLGVRYRRTDAIGRLQLRWLFFVVGAYVLFWTAISVSIPVEEWGTVGLLMDALFLASLPAAMAIAVLRYRLYDIDRIISRTVAYGLVAVVLGAVYSIPVVVLPRLLGESNDLVVAASTLAAAAVFNPVRRRIQGVVDRRFNRARYDAEHQLDLFADEIHSDTDLGSIRDRLHAVISTTLAPDKTWLWIR
jgi:hypothetical protein